MTTNTLWVKLANSKSYRKQFVSAQAKRAFAFQLRAIMKRRGLSQAKLAEQSGLTQGVISRAADPNYGKLTTTIIVKIANGLDMAYLGVLVPFSDATKWFNELSEESVQVPTFEEESQASLDSGAALTIANTGSDHDHFTIPASVSGSVQYGGAEQQGIYLVNKKVA